MLFEIDAVKSNGESREFKLDYLANKLGTSRKSVSHLSFVAALFNLLLMIPDGMMIGNPGKTTAMYIVRAVFSLCLLTLGFYGKTVKTFKTLSLAVSFGELISLAVFIYVLTLYEHANLLIQAMGMLVIIIIIFLVPNKWRNMLMVSIAGGIGFLISTYYSVDDINMVEYWAAVVYILLTTVLCAQAAYLTEKFQYREFIAKKKLEHISTTDYLTNTANRYKMVEEANKWISYCKRNDLPLTLVFVDIDDFKGINDRYGHLVGDSVLKELTELIRGSLRNSDVISRWGGDEFVLLFPDASLKDAISVTERIRTHIGENMFAAGIKLTCCFGLVEMKEDSDFEKMIREADGLMYKGKRREKDKLHYTCEAGPA